MCQPCVTPVTNIHHTVDQPLWPAHHTKQHFNNVHSQNISTSLSTLLAPRMNTSGVCGPSIHQVVAVADPQLIADTLELLTRRQFHGLCRLPIAPSPGPVAHDLLLLAARPQSVIVLALNLRGGSRAVGELMIFADTHWWRGRRVKDTRARARQCPFALSVYTRANSTA